MNKNTIAILSAITSIAISIISGTISYNASIKAAEKASEAMDKTNQTNKEIAQINNYSIKELEIHKERNKLIIDNLQLKQKQIEDFTDIVSKQSSLITISNEYRELNNKNNPDHNMNYEILVSYYNQMTNYINSYKKSLINIDLYFPECQSVAENALSNQSAINEPWLINPEYNSYLIKCMKKDIDKNKEINLN